MDILVSFTVLSNSAADTKDFERVMHFFRDHTPENYLEIHWTGNNYVENGTKMVLKMSGDTVAQGLVTRLNSLHYEITYSTWKDFLIELFSPPPRAFPKYFWKRLRSMENSRRLFFGSCFSFSGTPPTLFTTAVMNISC